MRVKNDTVLGQDWNNEDKKKMEKKYSQHCCHDGIIQVMKMKGGRVNFLSLQVKKSKVFQGE